MVCNNLYLLSWHIWAWAELIICRLSLLLNQTNKLFKTSFCKCFCFINQWEPNRVFFLCFYKNITEIHKLISECPNKNLAQLAMLFSESGPKNTAVNQHASWTGVLIYRINNICSGSSTCDRWSTEKKAIPISTAEVWNPSAKTTDGIGRSAQSIRDPKIDFCFSPLDF